MRVSVVNEFKRNFKKHKSRWLFSFIALQVIPVFEVTLISLIYLLLDEGKRDKIDKWLRSDAFIFQNMYIDYDIKPLVLIFCLAIFILLFQMALRYAAEVNLTRLRILVYIEDGQMMLAKYLYADSAILNKLGKERITMSLTNDCGIFGDIIKQSMEIIAATLTLFLYLITTLFLSWKMLLIASAIYALPLYISRKTYGKMQSISRLKISAQEEVLGFFTDILSGFQRSRVDALENELAVKSTDVLSRSQQWRLLKRITETRFKIIMDGLSLFGVTVIIFVGVAILKVEIAIIMLLFVVFNRMKSSISILTMSIMNVKSQIPHIQRYIELVEMFGDKLQTNTSLSTTDNIINKVECKNVNFSYDNQAVLKNINFKVQSGDRVLITGMSGQGKSTLIELLCGLLTPDSGEILINDMVFDESLFYKLRDRICYVSPDVYLFNDTLKNNITMGDCVLSDASLNDAIRLSGLDELVESLPNGIESSIGLNGGDLSLGQRQRVILARLYMRAPQLILLDEATANLDPALETKIIEKLQNFIPDTSLVVMISHKPPIGYAYNKHFTIYNGELTTDMKH